MELFQTELRGRDYEHGKKMFAAGKCLACHRFEGSGGHCGPDLGSLANRYSVRDILVAICDPSFSISEQYQASVVWRKDGGAVYGRVIYRDDKEIAVAANPYDFSDLTKVPRDDVERVELSQVSMMPAGTIALMNKEELSDLMAYLLSGGDPKHKAFQAQ